jgi:hypothetical protein
MLERKAIEERARETVATWPNCTCPWCAMCKDWLALLDERRWRRCEEEKPLGGVLVLAWGPQWHKTGEAIYSRMADDWVDEGGMRLARQPTHWTMPLPAPPEGT